MYQLQRQAQGMNRKFWKWVGESEFKEELEKLKYGNELYRYRKLKYVIKCQHSQYSTYKWVVKSFDDFETAYNFLCEVHDNDLDTKIYSLNRQWRVVR